MISDGGSDSAPPTPESHTAMPWQSHHGPIMGHPGHQLQRAASFADFGQHMNNYSLQQQYNAHRHSLSSSGPPEYQGAPPLGQTPLHSHGHPQHQQQHPGVQMLQRTGSIPHHNYFVPDQNNPAIATMNPNQHTQHPQYHPQVPRQGERVSLDIPPYSNAPDLASSIPNSSPDSYSASGRSPSAQDAGFYTHVAPGQTAAYALHAASPVTQQGPQMMAFQGQLPPTQAAAAAAAAAAAQVMTHPATVQPVQQQQQQQQQQGQGVPQQQSPEQYHPHHHHHHHQQQQQQAHAQQQTQQPQEQQQQQWYDSAQYQSPVEVATIGSLPPFGSGGLYDPWGPKLDFEDPSMQMPSARIESM